MLSRREKKRHLTSPDGVYLGACEGRFAGALLWPSSATCSAGRGGRRGNKQQGRLRAPALPVPACCNPGAGNGGGQPSLPFEVMVPAEGPKAFSCGESVTPSPHPCGTAQHHRCVSCGEAEAGGGA